VEPPQVPGPARTVTAAAALGNASAVALGAEDSAGGVARFTDLFLGGLPEGGPFRLHFSAPGLRPVVSAPFENLLGPPFALAVALQPGNAIAGGALSVAPEVRVLDQGGNLVPDGGTARTRHPIPLPTVFPAAWTRHRATLPAVAPTLTPKAPAVQRSA
jgi:hypothetical protein